jgi:deoxyribodipyrimidine photo-lyase
VDESIAGGVTGITRPRGRRWETAIVWFRRDLRVADHPALSEAVEQARNVVPLFVLDERLLDGTFSSPARRWFLSGSLAALDAALRERGSGLLVRSGRPEEVVPAVAREAGADVVLVSRDVTPYSHRRDLAAAAALARDGRRLLARPGLLLVEPETMLTSAGRPYGVFTPFWRSLQAAPRRAPLPPPALIPTPPGLLPASWRPLPGETAGGHPPLAELPAPGEPAARLRLRAWTAGPLSRYGADRDRLAGSGTSRLGQDLHLGLLSPLQVEEAALSAAGGSAVPFVRQLAWREFYHHLLFHRRAEAERTSESPITAAFRPEAADPGAVAAWREGRTGIPVVDAAMRQLAATGWLSNRARLVVASFLTRHLLIDYRVGEVHFMRHLVDGDLANNWGGWQWTAGVGADPQPWFRIFNPQLQGERFDPEGSWVRRWVPELAGVPVDQVHAPWRMDRAAARRAGVVLGESYPEPIVDLAFGRERALAAFRAVSEGTARAAPPRPSA